MLSIFSYGISVLLLLNTAMAEENLLIKFPSAIALVILS